MSTRTPKNLLFLVLCFVMSTACKEKGAKKDDIVSSGVAETTTVIAATEEVEDLTKLPHEAVNGLRLTAEVLDKENWIIGLTWENVGDIHLSLPMVGLLKGDIESGYAVPFLRDAYSRLGYSKNDPKAVILNKSRYADSMVFDILRDGVFCEDDTYDFLRDDWGSRYRLQDASFFRFTQYLSLGPGQRRTCFFRFPRYKSDEESGRWKMGDRIPVDFRYFVGAEVPVNNRVTLTSRENGQPRKHLPPSEWRGEVFSNVVYLEWNSGGERVRWPSSPHASPIPAEPVNHLLLSLEIIDEDAGIVRLKWKNVGDTPLEVPVTEGLMRDIKAYEESRNDNLRSGNYRKSVEGRFPAGKPFLFPERYYSNFRYYGRPFGTSLDRGKQGDAYFFDIFRDGNFWNDDQYLENNGFYVHSNSSYTLENTEWIHLLPGEYKEIDFKFPRFESDDLTERWQERQKIPIEFCFKAGEIPNSEPPYRETGKDGQSNRRRFPAWQGEVFSNVVFFTWSSEGERMKAPEHSK